MDNKISGKRVFTVLLLLFFGAITGMVIILLGFEFGKYLVYFSVGIGAILTIIAAIATQSGKIEKDF